MSNNTPPFFASKDTLDSSFGTSGITLTQLANKQLTPLDVAVLATGEIVLAVNAYDSNGNTLLLLRYDSQGLADSRFGTNGVVTTAFQASGGSAFAMRLQADGSIVIAGDYYNGKNLDFAVARYLADGSLDTGFATAGLAVTGFGNYDDRALAVTVQADGKIVAAGQTFDVSQDNFAVARYLSNGQLDTSFGTGGKATADFRKAGDGATAVALQADGKILVAGHSFNGSRGDDFGLVRFNSNGSFDTSFGSGGGVTTDIQGGNDIALALVVQSDGKIVLAGRSFNGNTGSAALVRYQANGSLDTSFGSGGIVVSSLMDTASDLIIRPDGKLVVSGSVKGDFALLRLGSNGQLDTTFGKNGLVTTSIQPQIDRISQLWLQSDGKLLATGTSLDAAQSSVVLARYGWQTVLADINEDSGSDTGQTIQSLYSPAFADAEGNGLAGVAIAANAVTAGEGQWQYSTDGGANWLDVGSVSQEASLLLSRDTRVRFLPGKDYFGTPGRLDVHLVDDSAGFSLTTGATRSSISLASSQAQTAISVQGSDLSIKVLPVNDAPVLTRIDPLTGALEDQSYTLSYDDLKTHSDASDVDGDPLVFRIDKLLAGQLTLNGQNVVEGTTILAAGASLVWIPPANANGLMAAFTLVAVDPSQAVSTANTVYVQVAAVNDAPTLSRLDTLANGVEDQAYLLRYEDLLTHTDAADLDGDTLSFRVESVAAGVLTLDGQPVVAGSTRLVPGSTLVWMPPANAYGTLVACNVVAIDPSGATSSTALPVRVDVTAVNDAPSLSHITPLTGAVEDTGYTIRYDTLLAATDASDVEGDPLVLRVEAVTAGILQRNGESVVPGVTVVSAGDVLTWTPPANANGTLSAFTVRAVDSAGAVSDTPLPVSIVVAAVNDPPTLTRITTLPGGVRNQPSALSYAELLAASDAADPDGDIPMLRIETLLAGTLTVGGTPLASGSIIQPGDSLTWTPPNEVFGAVTAFTVVAVDGSGAHSDSPVPVTLQLAYHDDPPTLTRINPLAGALEDQPYTLRYPDLLAASDAQDPDGDPVVFRITSVLSGSLNLDGQPLAAGNGLFSQADTLTWLPPANVNGAVAAFAVEVVDSRGVGQNMPISVSVDILAQNDPPTLTQVKTLVGAVEDEPYSVNYESLLAASDAGDVDGDAIVFRVNALVAGTLSLNGQTVIPGVTTLTSGMSLSWQPPVDANGLLTGFSIQALDTVTHQPSATPVPVAIRVTAVNDPPRISLATTGPFRYQEGGLLLRPWEGLNLVDVDTARLFSATVKLSGFNPLDQLAVNTVGTPITAHYDNQTGYLQLTGTAVLASYRSVLAGLTFMTQADLIRPEQRQLELTVNDGLASSEKMTTEISLKPSIINGSSRADTLIGTVANDVINGLGGNDFLDGRAGADRMLGWGGNDTYVVDNPGDLTMENVSSGYDTVRAYLNWVLGPNLEELDLLGKGHLKGTGNGLNNLLSGNDGNNVLNGLGGNDTLVGGLGADTLVGGGGADRFVYRSAAESRTGANHDIIVDFDRKSGDRIDLSAIDANSKMPGNQDFAYIGVARFTGAGQVRYVYDGEKGQGLVLADTNGDRVADIEIELVRVKTLTVDDFLL